jgi:DNA invertase Pin-like site-specific DNA recombinase
LGILECQEMSKIRISKGCIIKAGCELIFTENISGTSKVQPQFGAMLGQLRTGDTVVVWRIDRLGTTLQLTKLMVEFRERGVEFISLTEGINTNTQMGRIWFMLSSIFAENEREILKERTNAGLASAKARGKIGGRPKGLTINAKQIAKSAAAFTYR